MAFAFYKLVVRLYGFAISLAAPFNQKARQWVSGRKQWQQQLTSKIAALGSDERIWFHCASYGEFEQGRPLIEQIKKHYPNTKIVVSFFSPSGYEAFKSWDGADVIVYLPLDTPANAKLFLDCVQPTKVFIIKYEYWLCFLAELHKRKLPSYLVSATFKQHQVFFKWYGEIFRKSLQTFTKLFIQDKASLQLLSSIGVANAVLSGDTRVDRVLAIKAQSFENSAISSFIGNSFVFVAGSTWPADEKFLAAAFAELTAEDVKLIIAPHELTATAVKACVDLFSRLDKNVSLYSKGIKSESRILVLDTMGMLAKVYRFANMAYVGGGFGTGIHNTLEPAVYGIPVGIAGSGHEKFNEALQLMQLQVVFQFDSPEELKQKVLHFKSNRTAVEDLRKVSEAYFSENKNVADGIVNAIA